MWPPPQSQDTGTRKFGRYFVFINSDEVFIEACLWDRRQEPGSINWELTASVHRRPPDEKIRDDIPLLKMVDYTEIPCNIMNLAHRGEGNLSVAVIGALQKHGFGESEYEAQKRKAACSR